MVRNRELTIHKKIEFKNFSNLVLSQILRQKFKKFKQVPYNKYDYYDVLNILFN